MHLRKPFERFDQMHNKNELDRTTVRDLENNSKTSYSRFNSSPKMALLPAERALSIKSDHSSIGHEPYFLYNHDV